jgi:hypothetical protein
MNYLQEEKRLHNMFIIYSGRKPLKSMMKTAIAYKMRRRTDLLLFDGSTVVILLD